MRITRNTAAELQLEDAGYWMVAFGALALVTAVVVAAFAAREGETIAGILILGAFGGAGVVVLRRARSVVHRFDRQRATLTIEARPILVPGSRSVERMTYEIASLADLALEEQSSTGESGMRTHTFRPVYVFSDGRRIPLLAYYTSQVIAQKTLQAAVRAWLAASGTADES